MGSLEVTKTISQEDFTVAAEGLLNASDISVTAEESVESAKELLAHVAEIRSGVLQVQPPLSSEQVDSYETRAVDTIGLHEKTILGLDTSRRGRKELRKLAAIAAQSATGRMTPAPSFRGEGSVAKG